MRRFIGFLLWKVLVGSQVGALPCPGFDSNQDLNFAALAKTDYTCNRLRLELLNHPVGRKVHLGPLEGSYVGVGLALPRHGTAGRSRG